MANFYQEKMANAGVFLGSVRIQARGSIGGHRYVFVKTTRSGKDALVFPTVGGRLMNPFKGTAKIYAGDLIEYNPGIDADTGATVKILKTYEVAKAVTAATDSDPATTVLIVRNGYRHIPFVGDVIMAAPSSLDGKGAAVNVVSVEKTTDSGIDVWKLTLSATLGALGKGDVLVEGSEAGSSKAPMVTSPNCYAPCDYDFIYSSASSDDEFDGAEYMMTPCIANGDTYLYENRMSPLPASIKALNKSKISGWFNF